MPNLMAVLRHLESERTSVQGQIKQLDSALNVLQSLNSAGRGRGRGGPRHMSAAARNRIAAAQKARWAKWKAKHRQ